MYPPLCRLLLVWCDGLYPGSCICICITKFLASRRISYDRRDSLYSSSDARPRIMKDTTASSYDHENTLNLGYINQSRRYALPPKMATARNMKKEDEAIPANEILVSSHS
uniref:Putative secreted protein n=1 Tax=Anopheles marajoara TaxID=58244 RepID=A0A2M4C876_9DIPT